MTHAWTHAWCRDPSRDERVRAAEDGRDRPLPTLGECIETAFSAGVRDLFRKVEEAWAMIPKSVSGSSAPEQENKADGMRTERVTLEITIDDNQLPAGWPWDQILRPLLLQHKGESVRVVEQAVGSVDDRAYADRMGCDEERDFANRIIDQRDAAIRERDEAKARVAELEAARGGGEGEPVAWMCEWTDNVGLHHTKTDAEDEANGDIVPQPLYRAPPQPRGWLTGEEREAVQWAADAAYDKQHPAEDTLRNILARSLPPGPEGDG
jgi:hypothetical protein